jgi:hypothetical protein
MAASLFHILLVYAYSVYPKDTRFVFVSKIR